VRLITVGALLLLSACERQQPARYQAIPNQGPGVWVIDTQRGALRFCATSVSPGETPDMEKIKVACMPPADASTPTNAAPQKN
jgi:hypothetical protein